MEQHGQAESNIVQVRNPQQQPSTNIVKDVELCDLYYRVIRRLLLLDDSRNKKYFQRYINIFQDYADDFCTLPRNVSGFHDEMINLLKNNLHYRALYLYRNGMIVSSAVALHFQKLLEENESILNHILNKETVKICAIGAGDAAEVVAVTKVLESLSAKRGKLLAVHVTIVDEDSQWKNSCLSFLSDYAIRGLLKKVEFIQIGIARSFNSRAVQCIEECDIVTMVNYLSEYPHSPLSLRRSIKCITEAVRPSSLLFIMDKASESLIKYSGGYAGKIENMDLIYEELCLLHTLDLNAIEHLIKLYQKHLNALQCNYSLCMFVRVFLKAPHRYFELRSNSFELRFRDRNLLNHNKEYTLLNDSLFEDWKCQIFEEIKLMGGSESMAEEHIELLQLPKDGLSIQFSLLGFKHSCFHSELTENFAYDDALINKCTEEKWKNFFTCKMDIANSKREMYRFSVIRVYNHIVRMNNGCWN